jgi:hypothetical protein
MRRALLPFFVALALLLPSCAEPTPGPAPSAGGTAGASPTASPGTASLTSATPTSAETTATTDSGAAPAVEPPPAVTPIRPYAVNPLRENPQQNFQAGAPAPNPNPDVVPPGQERVTAGVGVGSKGRSLDKYQGATERVLVEPAKSLFVAQERLTFNVAIPQAMNLYKGEHGYFPRSHEVFMRDIIEFNRIQLPDLRPGQRYVYDPQRAELMVERPAR